MAPDRISNAKVYIAGPMAGHDHFNYPAFYDAYQRIKRAGLTPISPAHDNDGNRLNPPVPGYESDYRTYLKQGIEKLLDCDYILMLDGWMGSTGATLEMEIAYEMGIRQVSMEQVDKAMEINNTWSPMSMVTWEGPLHEL